MATRIRIGLNPYMAELVNGVAKLMGRSEPDVLELLLFRIETAARHGKLTELGIGLEWAEVADVLNGGGRGATSKDPVLVGGGEAIDFDVKLLETSRASKSGYAGVYATGSAFRALVTDPKTNGSRYLQSRPTAVLAAIDRFKWYEQWAMPYGLVGEFLQAEVYGKSGFAGITEPRLTLLGLEYARHTVDTVQGIKIKPDPAQIQATIKRYREVHGMVPEDKDPTMQSKDRFWVSATFTPNRPTPLPKTKQKAPKVSPKLVEVSPKLVEVSPQVSDEHPCADMEGVVYGTPVIYNAPPPPEPVQEPLPFVAEPVTEPVAGPAEVEICAVCKKPITDDRFTWFGRSDDMAHVLCLELDGRPRADKAASP